MKKNLQTQKKDKCKKNTCIISDLAEVYLTLLQSPMKVRTKASFKGDLKAFNIIQIQKKWKGPPGGRLSPERVYDPEPDSKTAARKGTKINQQKIYQINQYQISNFYHQQIFIHN